MGVELFLFLAFGALAVLFAIGMLLSENAVHSALFLIGNFASVAVLFIMLDAPFIAMVQIAVYAGAIMVLFLFVIMLLGAEKTSDTTRRFRWLTGTATTLVLAFLIALGTPLLLAGINLPQPSPAEPMLRVVHAANAPSVDVQLSGAGQETLALGNTGFGETSAFQTVQPGEWTLTMSSVENRVPPTRISFPVEAGDVLTLVINGRFDPQGDPFSQPFGATVIRNSFESLGDREARLLVFNGFSENATLALVDLGPDRQLSTRLRDVLDADGNPVLDASGAVQRVPVISDRILASGLAFGAEPQAVTVNAGTYNLAFVNESTQQVIERLNLQDYEIKRETEKTLILAAEPPAIAGDAPRPRLLDRAGDQLIVALQPNFGSPRSVGHVLFTDYLLPVNMVGILLLVGLVGAVVISRPDGEKRQVRLNRRRRVSRPLVNVISQQTGRDVVVDTPRLESPGQPEPSGD